MKLKPSSYLPELRNTIGDELLKVHVSYGPLVKRLLARFNSKSGNQGVRAHHGRRISGQHSARASRQL